MEVFVGFTAEDDIALLERTLSCWEACGVEPAAIECTEAKFEIARRVGADNLAKKQHYLLADIGCILQDPKFMKTIERRLTGKDGGPGRAYNSDNATMIGLMPDDAIYLPCDMLTSRKMKDGRCPEGCKFCDRIRQLEAAPTGVRIIRKGVIQKWLPRVTDNYDQEHAEAARLAAGGNWCPMTKVIEIWPDILFRQLPVH